MASLNDKDAWRGDIDAAIAMSISDAGMPLVDLNNDGEARPNGAVKDEPVNRGKHDVIASQLSPVLRSLKCCKYYYISV
jgi:hypothetical protein